MSFDRRLTVTIRSAMSSRIIFAVAAAVAATLAASAQAPGPDSVQQLVAMQRAWGPKANSAGAILTLWRDRERRRTGTQSSVIG